jgi:hypothetical protein
MGLYIYTTHGGFFSVIISVAESGADTGLSYRVFQNRHTTSRAYINLFRGHVQCFELHNVAKHTEFYLG